MADALVVSAGSSFVNLANVDAQQAVLNVGQPLQLLLGVVEGGDVENDEEVGGSRGAERGPNYPFSLERGAGAPFLYGEFTQLR
jgi:hypothetical protein